MKTNAESTSKSLTVPGNSGPCLPPSAPAAPHRSIPCDEPGSVLCLTLIASALMAQTLNPDCMWLAMNEARTNSLKSGITEEQFNRIAAVVASHWSYRRNQNPLSILY